jgi:putative MATE family efflux protein
LSASTPKPPVPALSGGAEKQLSGKLAGLSLPHQVFVLALWPFLENLLNFTVGITDMWVAGNLPDQAQAATAAITSGLYINWMQIMVISSVCIGAAAIISRSIGARHRRDANATLGQAMALGLAIGIAFAFTIFTLAPWLADIMGMQGIARDFCISYLRIMSFTGPAMGIMFVGNAAMRSAGDTRTPFLVMLTVNLFNMAATYFLTFGPAPFGGHGVKGIAMGTSMAWYVGAALSTLSLLQNNRVNGKPKTIRLYLHRLKPRLRETKRILTIGLPSLAESSGMWLGNFLVFAIVGKLGDTAASGAHGISIRLEALSYMPGFALGIASSTLTGQYLGLGDPHRARRAVHLCWYTAASIMTLTGICFMLFPHFLVSCITKDPQLIEDAAGILRIAGSIQFFFSMYTVFVQALRGAGDTRATMFITNALTFGVRLPGAYLLGVTFGLGLKGIWYALCIELTIRGLIMAARFNSNKWMTARV